MKFLGRRYNSHFNVLAKQFFSIALSYALIFVSVTSVSLTTVRAQTVGQPDTPKLTTSTGEAVLRTTEPPIKNLPTHEEMKRKALETDEVVKQHKVKPSKRNCPKPSAAARMMRCVRSTGESRASPPPTSAC